MEFRTRREAEEAAKDMETRATAAGRFISTERAAEYRAEAARVRALLSTLEEET